MVERQAVVAIVKHWSDEKYLCLRWKSNDWTVSSSAASEEEKTRADRSKRDNEETGYKNRASVRDLASPTHSQFYHEVSIRTACALHALYL